MNSKSLNVEFYGKCHFAHPSPTWLMERRDRFGTIFILIFIIKIQGWDTIGEGRISFSYSSHSSFFFSGSLGFNPNIKNAKIKSDYLMYKYFIMLTCITYEGDRKGHDCVHEDSKLQLTKYLLEEYFHFLFLLNLFISVGCQPLKNFIFIKK